MTRASDTSFCIGWAQTDITPERPVMIAGQFHVRIAEGIADRLTATAMAVESASPGAETSRVVLVSCDLVAISNPLRDEVRARLRNRLPELDPMCVVMSATHTHTGPLLGSGTPFAMVPEEIGFGDDLLSPEGCTAFIADRIADVIVRAWQDRQPAGIGYALAHAVVGHNRRVCYYSGETRMYGGVQTPDFSHLEAGSDHSVNVLGVWDRNHKLIGVIVNLAFPSQVSENDFQLSADYWHETRAALREQLGEDVFILPQVSAAGDLAPARALTVPDYRALERMWELEGLTQRQDIARRITTAVVPAVSSAARRIDWNPVLLHRTETVSLQCRTLTEQDMQEATAEADAAQERYEQLYEELMANPRIRQQPRWYAPITQHYRRMRWYRDVAERYERQKTQATLPYEVHVLRVGETAFAVNPFEYYMDFGLQIKARSPAIQTFVVQLAGPGTYLPTHRAVAGRSYSAIPASTPIGPAGGRELVEWTVQSLDELWAK